MSRRINLTAFAATEPRESKLNVSLYVSATDELGIGVTGYTQGHFALRLLHPPNLYFKGERYFPVISDVKDLGEGYYEIYCATKFGWPRQVMLGLTLNMRHRGGTDIVTGDFNWDRGQTIVSFALK
jgi:hypothetical protein